MLSPALYPWLVSAGVLGLLVLIWQLLGKRLVVSSSGGRRAVGLRGSLVGHGLSGGGAAWPAPKQPLQ